MTRVSCAEILKNECAKPNRGAFKQDGGVQGYEDGEAAQLRG